MKKKWKIFLCVFLEVLSLTMMLVGNFKGAESGDPNSPYHMMAVLGFFSLLAIVFIVLDSTEKRKEKRNKKFMESVWDYLRRK